MPALASLSSAPSSWSTWARLGLKVLTDCLFDPFVWFLFDGCYAIDRISNALPVAAGKGTLG